jgi:dipeptidase D
MVKSKTATILPSIVVVVLILVGCTALPATPAAPPPNGEATAPGTDQPQAATAMPTTAAAASTTLPTAELVPTSAPTTEPEPVPLKDALGTLEPRAVWQNFYDLTQVPRPSHHEEQIRDFMVQFGQGLGMETIVDDAGNVLIRKPAAKGMEGREGVVLQAHMDMVPQNTPETTYDPLTDPIDAYVEGEWVVADGTTLGADDGIGMAIAMAVLQAQTPPLGPIEALFTVNEEDGMDGALGLQPGLLQGTTLINLDWETEGALLISSAGGEYARIKAPYGEVNTPDGVQAYQVSVSGLTGGHSGTDINLGRGHATKLLVRLLSVAAPEYGVRLAEITGGTAANAIPQEATALVAVPTAQADAFLKDVGEHQEIVRAELAATEPNLSVRAAAADLPPEVMTEDAQRTIIDALYGTPQGVMRMSDAVPGLVETSTNIGIVQAVDGELDVTCYPRSSVDTELDDVAQMIASVWDLGGVEVTFDGRYPGWKANPDSPILGLMKDVYHDLYGQDPNVVSVHAGTECGVVQARYPGMDAVSIGPTLLNVHTTGEKLEIATVQKLADLLTETLTRIPEAVSQPTPAAASQTQVQPTGAPTSAAPQPAPATPAAIAVPTPTQTWEVTTLLVAPGEPGRLYALVTDGSVPLWASPTSSVRLMISDDFASTWTAFSGGLPVPPECMVNVNLDYFTPDALFASTCEGLYAWEGTAWVRRSGRLTDVVAVAYGQPDRVWAAAHGDGVIRSDDGGRTWRDASAGLITFGGMANLGIDPRDSNTLYGIIQPKYAGSYLRRGTAEGNWETMPTPKNNATIETGMAIDGASGALYLTTQIPAVELWRSPNPSAANFADVQWELVHTFQPEARAVLLASGWGPRGVSVYATIWPNWFDQSSTSTGNATLSRSPDGGYTWEQLVMP